MKVSLVAMRTWEFPVGILGGDSRVLRSPVHPVCNSSSTGNTGENSTAALRSHHLSSRRFFSRRIRSQTICTRHAIRARPHWALTLGMTEGTGRHRREIRASITRWRRGNGLRVGLGIGSRRQQAVRRLELLRRLGLRLLRRVSEERRRRQAIHGGVRSDGRRGGGVNIVTRGRREPGHVRPVRLSHVRCRRLAMVRLQRRQRVRLGDRILRLHGVLRHRHGRQWSRALRKRGGWRSRGMRTRIHGGSRAKREGVWSEMWDNASRRAGSNYPNH